MVRPTATAEIYQLHILLLQINPPIWRCLQVRSDGSIATLHDLFQIAFNWSDFHLHRFGIRAKEYGVSRMGCTTFTTDASEVRVEDASQTNPAHSVRGPKYVKKGKTPGLESREDAKTLLDSIRRKYEVVV